MPDPEAVEREIPCGNMAVLYHQVWIKASTAKVYEAISTEDGIGRWWDKPRAVESDEGVILQFNPGQEHGVLEAKVLEMVPEERVEWEFTSTHPRNSPAFAWTGTRAKFEISRRSVPPWAADRVDMVILDFRHSGLQLRVGRGAAKAQGLVRVSVVERLIRRRATRRYHPSNTRPKAILREDLMLSAWRRR